MRGKVIPIRQVTPGALPRVAARESNHRIVLSEGLVLDWLVASDPAEVSVSGGTVDEELRLSGQNSGCNRVT
jgi:hypothetical protein